MESFMNSTVSRGVMIGAPCSGSGKTVFTVGLLQALKKKGFPVRSFKCGPDYIDPMYHTKVLGVPCRNLDTWFTGDEKTVELFRSGEDGSALSVVEGVMGLYDGVAGICPEGSSYDLARILRLPIILVIAVGGVGRSLIAMVRGFQTMDTEGLIRGVFINKISKEMYDRIAPELERETGLPLLGFLPKEEKLIAPERHLGLFAPEEVDRDFALAAGNAVEKALDWDAFFTLTGVVPGGDGNLPEDARFVGCFHPRRSDCSEESDGTCSREDYAEEMEDSCYRKGCSEETEDSCSQGKHYEDDTKHGIETTDDEKGLKDNHTVVLAVARDPAFSFLYEDNLRELEKEGANIRFFSPIKDKVLPQDCDGLYLPGGYPELYLKELSENQSMRQDILSTIKGGLPTIAECGGFLYLGKSISDDQGNVYPMVGLLPGTAERKGKSRRFGYVTVKEKVPAFLSEGITLKGHEFHYYESTENGSSCRMEKPVTQRTWEGIFTTETLWAGFPHIYFPAEPGFVRAFVGKMRRFRDALR